MTMARLAQPPEEGELVRVGPQQLQKLGPKHKDVLTLLAQGLRREDIAAVVGFTPEYITWLVRQPLCQEYMAEINAVVDTQLEAMWGRSVQAISDGLDNGTVEERLKAARLQMEATKRVGRGSDAPRGGGDTEHLESLAQRLVGLLRDTRGRVMDGTVTERVVEDTQ